MMTYHNSFSSKISSRPLLLIAVLGFCIVLYFYQTARVAVSPADLNELITNSYADSVISDAKHRTYVNLVLFLQAGIGMTFIVVPFVISMYRNRAVLKRMNNRARYVQSIQGKLHTQKSWAVDESDSFENQLLQMFPHLTAHDLKICALLRQNFSSKEIAEQLNITPGSVNTARYRLRKKLNLPKEADLIVYLNKIA
ncbi:MAG: LuxR C-terminal-related transcriptional regulator [Bacteroidota bacterium]